MVLPQRAPLVVVHALALVPHDGLQGLARELARGARGARALLGARLGRGYLCPALHSSGANSASVPAHSVVSPVIRMLRRPPGWF